MASKRNTHKRHRFVLPGIGVACASVLVAGYLGFGIATAGAQSADTTSFGISQQSKAAVYQMVDDSVTPASEDQSPKSAAATQLGTAAARDNSRGVAEIAAEEEEARRAAEEAERRAEQAAIKRAEQARAAYLANFGSMPAGDVDFSIGKKAFIQEWTARIDAYLAGSALAGYGNVFATAAWENGVDPRWSPAISNTESTKGSHCFLYHNAWGWGQSSWGSWEQAINAHVSGLASSYGFTINIAYARAYCPPTYQSWYSNTLSEMYKI